MSGIYESDLEEHAIALLQEQGYDYLSPEELEAERSDFSDVVLRDRLIAAVDRLNPDIPSDARQDAMREVLNLSSQSLIENNEAFHRMLIDGVRVEYQKDNDTFGDSVSLIDFENPMNNDLSVCNQFTVIEANKNRRPDIVLLVNGLPLAVIELKNPADENATVKNAYTQFQNYKRDIPSLFHYNGVLVASDGFDAKVGSLTAEWSRFTAWKTVDGVKEDKITTPQLDTLIKGMLRPDVFLDLIRQFTVFEKSRATTSKKIAAYHQYHAVNKAVESTIRAAAVKAPKKIKEDPQGYRLPSVAEQPVGDRKVGVIWHTQGSGKSLSMVFYAGKLIVDKRMKNPTLVVITDRNDLDDQLFDTFAASRQLLRQEPIQANSREHLKKLLRTAGGGIVFTTIQKFSPENGGEHFESLSERENIVVIADEAHRSHYGFGAKTLIKGNEVSIRYGFAKYLRDAIPNASFIGFTGTPIEKEDISTPAIFGNYIDIYDIFQAVEDGATVPIHYQSRLPDMHLPKEQKEKIDALVEQILESEELPLPYSDITPEDQDRRDRQLAVEKAKAERTRLEAIIGNQKRLELVAQDILKHFGKRQEVLEGKGMIVTLTRDIAARLYEEIIKFRPDWHDTDIQKGGIKVVISCSSDDEQNLQSHRTSKLQRRELYDRFKDPNDPLKLIIVCDMWLTGFDAPCLHTMYIDKLMRGHTLMQAIARANRVYKDKPGGLIVDYIGIVSNLKQALQVYTASGGKGEPLLYQSEAIAQMTEKYEVVVQMFNGFDYKRFFSADTKEKLTIILEAQEYILGLEDGKNRFIKQVSLLDKAFALSVPSREAMALKEELGFFQAVKARMIKFKRYASAQSDAEIETAIRQIVNQAIVVDEVIDIYDAAGIKKPDISILSDEFLAEVQGMKYKNLAIELLRKILNNEIKTRIGKNIIQSKKLSEMLDNAIKKYKNNLLDATQIIEELIGIAKEIKASDKRGEDLGLSDEEIAFYDALADNDSAKTVLGDDTLREIARVLVKKVRADATIDWTIKESVRARLRVTVKRVLRKYGYPPDKQELAVVNVLKQAENFADEWAA